MGFDRYAGDGAWAGTAHEAPRCTAIGQALARGDTFRFAFQLPRLGELPRICKEEATMLNPFQKLELIQAEVFTSMPGRFRQKGRTTWSDPNRQNAEVECFLEGPAFDREGNLYLVDTAFQRIFRITPKGDWDEVVRYDGWPNGMKFHQDGRLYVADYRRGIMVLDVKSGKIEPLLETAYSEGFKGCNDLAFASNGDLYFTDQGQSGIVDPTGRVYRLKADGSLQRLVSNCPSPNGITVSTTDQQVYIGVTRSQQVWRLPIMEDGQVSKAGSCIQVSGGVGPDGIEMAADNGLYVCHLNVGVWLFDAHMLPTHLIHSADRTRHDHITNVALGGADLKTAYMTDAMSGDVLMAKVPVAGKKLFGLS
jgi:gluconolactonase